MRRRPTTALPPSAPTRRHAVHWLVALVLGIWAASFVAGFETSLIVLTGVGYVLAVLGVRWPAAGVLGVSMLCTLDALTRSYLLTGGLLRWHTFNYFLLGAFVLFSPSLGRLRGAPLTFISALTALLALEITMSGQFALGAHHLLNIVCLYGLLVFFARARMDPTLWRWIAIVNGTLAAAGGLVYYIQDPPGMNPNAWAWFPLTAILSIGLAASVEERPHLGLLLPLLAFVNLVWVLLSASRSDLLIGLVATSLLVTFNQGLWRRALYALLGVILVVALASQFVSLTEHAIHRVGKLTRTDVSLRGRTSGRSDLALGAWYIFKDNPLGVGTGGFEEAWVSLGNREGLSGFKRGLAIGAHSAWAKTLAENGLPGFVLLVAFVGSFAVVGWRQRRPGLRRLGLLTTGVLAVACLSSEFQGKGLWLLAAGTMMLLRSPWPLTRRVPAVGRRDPTYTTRRLHVAPR